LGRTRTDMKETGKEGTKEKAKAYNTYIAPQTANCSCSGALRHRQSGRAAYRP